MRAKTRVGTVLREKWRIDALLGVGGMAAVYAATHRNGTRAAVKVLHPELVSHPSIRSRFLKEGYVANRIDHPGAVRVTDDDTAEDGSMFLVMELLDGESLEDRRVRLGGTLDVDEVLSAADQVLDVLAQAHEKGIVHRDIKPENVFLTRTGAVKVLDFGIARLRELSTPSTATRTGTTMGTPAFMAPEHARGLWDEVDAQSDLWSVGAAMYCMLSGRVVHEGRTTNEVLLAAMTKPAPQLRAAQPSVPEPVGAIVDRALMFDKAQRWPDARAMQDAIRRAYHRIHGAPISTQPPIVVPDVVPNRTLPSALANIFPGGVGGTGAAVSSGRTGAPLRTLTSLPKPVIVAAAVTVAGVIAFAIFVTVRIANWRGAAESAPAFAESSGSAPALSPATAAAAAPPSPTPAPSVAPSESARAPSVTVPKPSPGARPSATASAAPPELPAPDWKEQRK
ncbi:MAG: serine/threonine protein kinase [Myxococcales bacterium]|nr:serine/threonine protein kinase [Myxococcales bacterium]